MSLFSFKCLSKNKSPTIDKTSSITDKTSLITVNEGFGLDCLLAFLLNIQWMNFIRN